MMGALALVALVTVSTAFVSTASPAGAAPAADPLIGPALATPHIYAGGGVLSFGAPTVGAPLTLPLSSVVVAQATNPAATPADPGYWLASADGGVYTAGNAGFYGSLGALHLQGPIVAMAATPDGRGYWLAALDGGVFAFGDAAFFGSAGGIRMRGPVVGMAPSTAPAFSPQDYTLTGDVSGSLLPGSTGAVDLRITNPNPVPITVVSDTTTITTSRGSCPPSNFASLQDLRVPVVVPAGSSVTLSQAGVPPADWPTVTMVDTPSDQDACAGAVLTLHYRGEAIG